MEIIVILFMIVALIGFLIGLSLAKRIAENKIDEMRKEMQLDCKEPNMWIDGNWYTEVELENKFHEMQDEIRELKKSNEIYRTMANNALSVIHDEEGEVTD